MAVNDNNPGKGPEVKEPQDDSKNIRDPQNDSNTIKDPDDWKTGDEEMTGAQRSYLQTLCEEAKEPFDDKLTKAEASKRIDELQHKTGRGLDKGRSAGQAQH
jgi:hypothetical protein